MINPFTNINIRFSSLSFALVILLFSVSNVFSQDPVMKFEGKAKDQSGKKMSGVTVKIYQDGNEVHSVVTGSNGRYETYDAEYGYVYKVVFSKEGFVNKSIEVNGKDNFFEEDVEEVVGVPIEMGLFKREPGIDYSPVESKPVGKYHIDKNTGFMDVDRVFTNSRKKEIDDFFKKIANASKDKDKKFTELVKAGDKAFKSKKYENAINNWKAALDVKEDDDVSVKITDAEMLLDEKNEGKELDEKFDKLIKSGDDLLASNKFEEAIKKYEEAQQVKQKDKLPKTKIAAVNNKRNNLEKDKLKNEFNDLMTKAEKEISAKNYSSALETLDKAKKILPKEKTPDQKIKQVNKIIESEAKNRAKYESLITSADNLFTNKSLKEAKTKYKEALTLITGEKHPTNRIIEIDKLINEKEKSDKAAKEKKAEYDEIIEKADKELKNKSYSKAKELYTQSLNLFPDESYPNGKLTEIDNVIKENEDSYNNFIAEGDKLLSEDKPKEAIIKYKEALKLKVEEYPNTQIEKANSLIAKAKKDLLNAEAIKEEYKKLIKEGDKEFKNDEFTSSKNKYKLALDLFPEEVYPSDKLKEIEALLVKAEEKYKKTIEDADRLVAEKEYKEAISKYEEALKLKKAEVYPANQIIKVKDLIAEESKNKLDADALKKVYDNLITDANNNLKDKKYKLAKEEYAKALNLFSNEKYPKEQILLIEGLIKEKEDEYNGIISAADSKMNNEKYEDAIRLYENALEIKTESYPKSQIEKANKLIADKSKSLLDAAGKEKKYKELKAQADRELSNQNLALAKEKYNEALAIKPDESEPKKQIEFIDEMIRKRKERYDKYITEADNLFGGEKFEVAIEKYEEAIWVMPVEQYPKDQIELARKRLEGKKDEVLALKDKEKKYNQLIEKGNVNFSSDNLLEAKVNYKAALLIKSEEQYPKDQLAIIEKKLKDAAEEERLASKEKNKEKAYNELIVKADNNFDNSKFEIAKGFYKEAFAIKSENYPQDQIDIINKKLEQLTQSKELEKQYNKIIAVADKKFNEQDYKTAKVLYKRALNFKPSDPYPPLKIGEINRIEAELEKQAKLKEEEEIKKNILFSRLIKEGDDNFGLKRYQAARDNFQEALDLKPGEVYPKQKITELDIILTKIANEKEKYKKFSSDYFDIDAELYGEEVDISEGDANILITKTQDNKEYRNYMKLRNYIDSMNILDSKSVDRNINTTYLSYKDYQRIQEEIILQNGKNDFSREASITSFELFREYHIKEKADLVKKSSEYNGEIASQIDVLKEGITQNKKNGQNSIEKNAKNYENLSDRLIAEKNNQIKNNIENTSEINNQTKRLKERLIREQADGQESIERNALNYENLNNRLFDQKKEQYEKMTNNNSEIANQTDRLKEGIIIKENNGQYSIEKNAKNYENLSDRLAAEQNNQAKENINKTSEIADQTERLKERLIEEQSDGQESIERNAENYENLNDRLIEQKQAEYEKMTNKSNEIADQTDRLKEGIIIKENLGQATIEKNAKNYENLTDRLTDEKNILAEKNIDNTNEISAQTEILKEKLIASHGDGQAAIEKNAENYENYNDALAVSKRKKTDKQTRGSQEISNQIDNLKEKKIAKNMASNLATENNSIKYENLSDRLTAEKQYKKDQNTANSYRNSKNYENLKENLNVKQSDATINDLAAMFPEGVTQKIYQRKNEFGEVTEVTVRRIVVKGNKGSEFRKTTSRSGSFYFKNGQSISESTWDIETSGELIEE